MIRCSGKIRNFFWAHQPLNPTVYQTLTKILFALQSCDNELTDPPLPQDVALFEDSLVRRNFEDEAVEKSSIE